MNMIDPPALRLFVAVVALILTTPALSAALQVGDAKTKAGVSSSKTQEEKILHVDLSLVRRAVVGGHVSAREGKKALEFYRLCRDKGAGTLSAQELESRLKELGLSWSEGESLLKKLAPAATVLSNGDFETGNEFSADKWTAESNQAPKRSKEESHDGSFSIHSKLSNQGAAPCEGLLRSAGQVEGGVTYRLQFWIRPVSIGPSYLTQYQLQWLDRNGGAIDGTGFKFFKGRLGDWNQIEVPQLVAPANADKVSLTFRFVTGAVEGGHGEIYIDSVALYPMVTP